MTRVARFTLVCLAFVLPWEDSLVVPGVGSIGRVLTLLAITTGFLALLAPGGLRLRRPTIFLAAALAFFLWSGLSFFWSADRTATLVQFAIRGQLFLLVFFIWQLATDRAGQLALLQAYVLGCIVAVFSAIFNYVSGSEAVYQRYSASGVDPNEFATILALGIPMAWIIVLSGRNRLLAWLSLLFIPLAIFGILLSSSRGGALVALVGLSIIPLTFAALPRTRRRAVAAVAALGVLGLLAFAPEIGSTFTASVERLAGTSRELSTGTLNERSEIWSAGLTLFESHALLGVGAGAFPEAIARFTHVPKVAHNSFISIMVELGPLGLLLFGAVCLSVAVPLLRLPRLELLSYLVLLITLLIGLVPLTWEGRKFTWFVLALISAAAGTVLGSRQAAPRELRHA